MTHTIETARFLCLRLFFLNLILFLSATTLHAQVDDIADQLTTIDDITDLDDQDYDQNYQLLTELQQHPIDLNTATPQQLQQLPFLTAQQIEDIAEHIHRYGPIQTEGELAMIQTIDSETRHQLLQFVTLNPQSSPLTPHPSSPHSRSSTFIATTSIPLYQREGDNTVYHGYPYAHSIRYMLSTPQCQAAIVGAQNPGEPFFANKNKLGYDHYALYLQAHPGKNLRNIVVGHYRLQLALGLVMNNNLAFGKLITLNSTDRSYTTLRGHSSRIEYNYLQGFAATLATNNGNISFTPFVSLRQRDATLNSDNTIRTLLTTGLHRTTTELNNKNNITEFIAGGRLTLKMRNLHFGVTALHNTFSKPLQPGGTTYTNPSATQRYRNIYPKGQHFTNASIDYTYHAHAITINGETATAATGGVATLNTLNIQPSSRLRLTALQRFYSYRYYALHSQSFSEGGRVQNESGFLVAAKWNPSRSVTLTAYADYAYFPYPRYQVSQSSHAWDYLAAITYQHGTTKLYARYRLRLRQHDLDAADPSTTIKNTTDQRLHTYITLQPHRHLTLKTQLDLSQAYQTRTSTGCMISQAATLRVNIRQNNKTTPLTINAHAAWFHTDDYNSRLYLYERSPLYQMSLPMLYGHGMRYAVFAQAHPTRTLTLTARVATTNYFDRSTISSGHQLIQHSSKTDIDLQLRYRF